MRRDLIILCCMAAGLLGAPAVQADSRQDELYGVYVATIKQELTTHGYEAGPPGGTLDPATVRAILEYQHDAGLTADGQATPELLNHLMFALPQIHNKRPQSDSSLVSQVQAHLADRGYYAGLVDGKAGPRTREAIELFQADAGLPVTGTVDRALLDHLATKDPGIRIN
jgi:peptidoglycan hydrolase-like protein with peptidoglycan-binding domain